MKEAWRDFPTWTEEHKSAFESIKALVVSCECLITIDHENLGKNTVSVTCDASDWWMGATLSVGTSWESVRLVAFDSMQLKAAEKNYPMHEKELLAVIRALKKWRSDLLGIPIYVYTDHQTLENFDTQRNLSRHQLRWQEFVLQYNMTITYIPGEDNSVADALSWIPEGAFPGESVDKITSPFSSQTLIATAGVHAILSMTADPSVLETIWNGYENDEFCKIK
jgi:hypothetical protein